MKTNYLTKLIQALLALTLFALFIGNAAAQTGLTLKSQPLQATLPGEATPDGGESF